MKKRNGHRRVLLKVITLLPEFCPLQDKIQQDVNKRKNNNTSQNCVGSTDRSYSTFIRTWQFDIFKTAN